MQPNGFDILYEEGPCLVVNKADCKGADILAMDLEAVTRKGSAKPTQVSMTVATEGKGVVELLDRIDKVDSEHRDDRHRQGRLVRPPALSRERRGVRQARHGPPHDPVRVSARHG